MPLDPKMIDQLFQPGAGVRMHIRPLTSGQLGKPSPTKGVPRPCMRGPKPHLRGICKRGREYHGRTVRQWLRLWGLDVSNFRNAMLWEGRLRWHFNELQGNPDQFLAHARQKGWIQ